MESISGLPAHVLFVHAPVVLTPLAALAALMLVFRPDLRHRAGIALAVMAGVVAIATFLALQSGKAFNEVVGDNVDTSDHEQLARRAMVLVIAFLIGAVATAAADRWSAADGPDWLDQTALWLMAFTTTAAVAASFWMVLAGDAGARLVWDGVISVVGLPGG